MSGKGRNKSTRKLNTGDAVTPTAPPSHSSAGWSPFGAPTSGETTTPDANMVVTPVTATVKAGWSPFGAPTSGAEKTFHLENFCERLAELLCYEICLRALKVKPDVAAHLNCPALLPLI
eukprot:337743-Amphidinium_carterae.1